MARLDAHLVPCFDGEVGLQRRYIQIPDQAIRVDVQIIAEVKWLAVNRHQRIPARPVCHLGKSEIRLGIGIRHPVGNSPIGQFLIDRVRSFNR